MNETAASAVRRQAARALQVANHVRRARAKLKTRVAEGDLAAADIILTPPPELDRMPVAQLLASQRGWGEGAPAPFSFARAYGKTRGSAR